MRVSLKINGLIKLKEIILYLASSLFVFYLLAKVDSAIIISSSLSLFWYCLFFTLVTSIFHIGGQIAAFYFSSKEIFKAFQAKKPIPKIHLVLPSIFETIVDVLLLYSWNVLFPQYISITNPLTVLMVALAIRFFNRVCDRFLLKRYQNPSGVKK